MQEIAIIGSTASGKTSLGIKLAKKIGANILSLDSLSVYKEIDIASAKPTHKEMLGVQHFGIDSLHVDEEFNVTLFFQLYKDAKKRSEDEGKNLIIVGGTGFYLKSMIEGISNKPKITLKTKQKIDSLLHQGYKLMCEFDKEFAKKISKNDTYRIEKWLEIYLQTGLIPTEFFQKNYRKPIIKDINLFEILVDKESLQQRISQRTKQMIESGLIDEVFYLEKKYTREPRPMKAIGIIETLSFFDGHLNKNELKNKIATNTTRLAKRQKTFNASQFNKHFQGTPREIEKKICSLI